MDTLLSANGAKRRHEGTQAKSYKRRRHQYSQMRVNLEKTIAGRYRNNHSNYDRVGVLLLCWQDDDMDAWTQEIHKLEDIFQKRYNYEVHQYRIPSEKADTATHKRVADFAHQYDGPNNLTILYYGGHGWAEDNRLKLYAKCEGNGDGDPSTFFDGVVWSLQHCDTDVLIITDCCFASLAFSRVEVGKRKFELLTATGPTQEAHAPQNPSSFTGKLCTTLRELANISDSFTTSKLYRELYFKADAEHKPFLFDQSKNDWGRICLEPARTAPEPTQNDSLLASEDSIQPENADLCLHLELQLSSKPKLNENMLRMNDLAKAMQYLPHVKEVRFKHMHAPDEDLNEFMRGVKQAMKIRPLLKRLRKRIEIRKANEKRARENANGNHLRENEAQGKQRRRHAPSLYDWNESHLEKANEDSLDSIDTPQMEEDMSLESD